MSNETYSLKVKGYMKVFYQIIGLTVLELAFLYLPLPKVYIVTLVCIASIAKAVLVGWHFMHLSHETRWLKIVAILPIIAFCYAVVLLSDASFHTDRAAKPYIPTPPRVFGKANHVETPVIETPAAPAAPPLAPPSAPEEKESTGEGDNEFL